MTKKEKPWKVNSLFAISMLQFKKALKKDIALKCTKYLLSACLNSVLMAELDAELSDLEAIQIGWEHTRSFLYGQLIDLLGKSVGPDWSNNLIKCKHCGKFMALNNTNQIACMNWRMSVGLHGQVESIHEIDYNWNITNHLRDLKTQDIKLNHIYWQIWSQCHYLQCTTCEWYYPVFESHMCRYHPNNEPIFQFIEETGVSTRTHPLGRYICCNTLTYRYHSLPQLTNGCKQINHIPKISNNSTDILRIYEMIKLELDTTSNIDDTNLITDKICLLKRTTKVWDQYNSCSLYEKGLVYLQKNYNDLIVEEQGCIRGNKERRIKSRSQVMTLKSSQDKSRQEVLCNEGCCLPMQDINADEQCFNRPIQYTKRTIKHKKTRCGLQSDQWVNRFSTRFNQDRQREWEKNFFHMLATALTKRHAIQISDEIKTDDKTIQNDLNLKNGLISNSSSGSELTDHDGSDSSVIDSIDSSSTSYCSTLKSNVRVWHSRSTPIWNSHTPLAGCYVRIETELRNHRLQSASGDQLDNNKNVSKSNTLLSKVIKRSIKSPTFTVHHNRRFYTRSLNTKYFSPRIPVKTKILEIPVLEEPRSMQPHKNIWSFDTYNQELDYLSATYIPVPITINTRYYKYLKTIKHELANKWDDLVDLEKAWGAFLRMFFETELAPNKRIRYILSNDSR